MTTLPRIWNYEESVSWMDTMEWLCFNYLIFPDDIVDGYTKDIGKEVYKNWRFTRVLPENEIYFGNCLLPGINKEMYEEYKCKMKIKEI